MENDTLKRIKRSYRRLEDRCLGIDMGWSFYDRQECMAILRNAKTVEEVFNYSKDLVTYLVENEYPEEVVRSARRWMERWGWTVRKDYDTDDVRLYLANAKDEFTEEEEPDLDSSEHEDWLMETWDDFDDRKAADVFPCDTPYTEINEAVKAGLTVGDIYTRLDEIDEQERLKGRMKQF